jgi:ElaB/YqjD/DUF883 family membrane-anchored ribosome-binding protein
MDTNGDRVTTRRLMDDLRVLAADTEQLLRVTAGDTGQHVVHLRAKAEESLRAARERLANAQDVALARATAAGRATDAYVHANPWQVVALGAVAGLAVGFMLTRGTGTSSES